MKVICVDDEPLAVEYTLGQCALLPEIDEKKGFTQAQFALDWLHHHTADLAILDINMPQIDGITLAARIKQLHPETAILFLTAYKEYAFDAYAVHPTGYLLKPVSQEKLAAEVRFARGERHSFPHSHIYVKTFGTFDVYVDARPVSFKLSKAKELLAYLVDQQGSGVTRSELFAAVWEDSLYDRRMQKQLDVYIRSLRGTLQEYGIPEILEMKKGVLRIRPEAFSCDAYLFYAYYGKWVPLEQARLDCGVSRDGSKAKNIYLAAEHYGFSVKAFRMSPESLKEKGQFPCIIHWNMNHFVVLDGFKGKWVYLNDPARGEVKVSWDEFDKSFTGVTIIPVPGVNFEPGGKRKSTIDFARKRLIGAGAAVAFVMLTTAISYLFGIANSVTSRIFMDRLLTGINRDWLYPFISVMILLAAVQLIVALAQTIYSLKINGKMAVIGNTTYMWKVLHLPMEFFSQRLSGDIQSRAGMNASIAGTLVNTFAPLLLNTVMMVFYLVLMLRQSPLLSLIGIVTLALNAVMARVISTKRMNVTRVQMRDAAKLESTTATGISMIETIKASGAENGFFQKWAGYQASVNAQNVKAAKTNQFIGMIPAFFSTLANYAVLVVGVWMTMSGTFTLGAVLMFQGFLGSFMSPAMTLISAGQTIQEMRTQMERVEDVMEYPTDENVEDHDTEVTELSKLKGNVELKDITFGYSRLEAPLIEDFSLSLKTGQRVALVGSSGCGKSTISKLVSGLYQPWSGEILFDGKPRSAYPREVMVGSLAVVDQDIILFEDTVANNIKMWDDSIQDFEMILAARDAQIHDDITALPGGYQHKLISGGKNFSGGQRQRMEIARVLAQDPTIIILDEATSALDARTEYEVVNAIRDRGITCIVIAHRLSTVRDCDEIIVLDKGKVVERGTHDELMARGGAYADLVANE